MADAKPSKMHGEGSHDNIPTKEAAAAPKATIRLLDVSGKAVKLVAEYDVGNGTVRRDYE
jgi:hypothetical protein